MMTRANTLVRRLLTGLFVVSFLAIAVVSPAWGRDIDKEFRHTFDASPGTKLVLHSGDGDVDISPWARDEIDVEVIYHASVTKVGVGAKPDFEVEFDQTGDIATVKGLERGAGFTIGVYTEDVHAYTYTIRAPSYVILEVNGDDGDVRIEGWEARVRARIDDGDLHLVDIKARVDARLSDGDFEGRGLDGDVAIESDDGDIVIADSRFDRLSIAISDGDVLVRDCRGPLDVEVDDGEVELRRMVTDQILIRGGDGSVELDLTAVRSPDWEVRTDDGAILLDFAEGLSARYTLDTEGRLRLDFPGAPEVDGDERVRGEIGEGIGRVDLRSDEGEIRVREVRDGAR